MAVVTIEVRYDEQEVRAMRDFLKALSDGSSLPSCSRWQDKARRRCSRNGWAYFSRIKNPHRGWTITDSGCDYLKQLEE